MLFLVYRNRRLIQTIIATTIVLFAGCNVRQDRLDSQRAAERIHAHMKSQDFQFIYRESGENFKGKGDESKFVAVLHEFQASVGSLRSATPIAYQSVLDTSVGKKHVLIFELEFERGRGKERMVFTRSRNGQMQLWELTIDPLE